MNQTLKTSRIMLLTMLFSLVCLLSIFMTGARTASAAQTDLQQKASNYCNNKYKGNSQEAKNERINCRKGFKAGHNGGNKNEICHPPLTQSSINACKDGFDKGKAVAPDGGAGASDKKESGGEGGAAGGGDGAKKNEIVLGTQGSHQCGNLPEEGDNWKTKLNFGCLGENGPSGLGPIPDLLFALIRFLSIGVGVIITLSIVAAGIQYTTAEGNAEASQAAKKRIQNAIIGLAIYIFAYTALQFLIPGGLFTGNWITEPHLIIRSVL